MGLDRECYDITKYPHSVDSLGVIQTQYGMPRTPTTKTKTRTTTNDAMTKPINDKARPSNKPTGLGTTLNPYIDKAL